MGIDIATIIICAAGLALLILGAELLVRGASRLAAAAGISPLIIGLTIVAFGTSAPELALSLKAVSADKTALSLGDVVGSNNVLFILGLAALIIPIRTAGRLLRLDVPIMIAASSLLMLLALDASIGRLDGALLLSGIIAYTFFTVRQSRKQHADIKEEFAQEFGKPAQREGQTTRRPDYPRYPWRLFARNGGALRG